MYHTPGNAVILVTILNRLIEMIEDNERTLDHGWIETHTHHATAYAHTPYADKLLVTILVITHILQ